MATDIERAKQAAEKKLARLQQQFNVELPAQMAQVQQDVARLERAAEAAAAQLDVADLVAKYGGTPAA